MTLNRFCFALAVSSFVATGADAQLQFIIDATATNSDLGYLSGEDYSFTFTLEPTATAPDLEFSASTRHYYFEEDLSDQELWATVTGDGLSGAYSRPSEFSFSPSASVGPWMGGDEFRLIASSAGDVGIGLSADGILLSDIQFRIAFASDIFDVSTPISSPFDYFSNYYGTYAVLPGGTNFIGTAVEGNSDQANFNVNTLTIIPEPTSLALLGLPGLLIVRRRR